MQTLNEKIYVNQLAEGQKIDSLFHVKYKEVKTIKTGGKFISVMLSDKTGVVGGVIWDNVEELDKLFSKEDIVEVRAQVGMYGGQPQLKIGHIKKTDNDFDASLFLPAYTGDIGKLKTELQAMIRKIEDKDYRKVIDSIFTTEFLEKFENAPAAVNMHHGYLGGLLEHTVAIAAFAEYAANFYKANKDLLITAALLHDVGKIEELSVGTSISYSEEGRMLGHLSIADHLVAATIDNIKNFPVEKALQLRHALLSHHGELEWGSPKRPKTKEALILHHLDNLDAKMGMFNKAVSSLDGERGWTDGRNPFGRSLYSEGRTDFFVQETIDGI